MRKPKAIRLPKVYKTYLRKVEELFKELAGDRMERFHEPRRGEAREIIAKALAADFPKKTAREIAFHLVDWEEDAAFILAVLLFPVSYHFKCHHRLSNQMPPPT